jgi:hypothetical protein
MFIYIIYMSKLTPFIALYDRLEDSAVKLFCPGFTQGHTNIGTYKNPIKLPVTTLLNSFSCLVRQARGPSRWTILPRSNKGLYEYRDIQESYKAPRNHATQLF